MSHPLPDASFTVRPDAVEALASDLRALATELADDAGRVRWAAASFPNALSGDEGWAAGATATAWARLQEVLADRTSALARTLSAAAAAYLTEDVTIAGRSGRPPR
jgi:hypothetical protein